MRRVYCDISATTPIDSNVLSYMNDVDRSCYGNPSSIHQFGQSSKAVIEKARRQIASSLNCRISEIIFTSGGSEANNLILRGCLQSGDHVISSSYEHPAILSVLNNLRHKGIEVSLVKPRSDGSLNIDDVEKTIRTNTKLISIMMANNEIGSINSIENLRSITKNKSIVLHSDTVQTIGKVQVDFKKLNVDAISLSAHKFYGPKGVGALIAKESLSINPQIIGGNQEKGLRAGTENISGIGGMGLACEIATKGLTENTKKIKNLEGILLQNFNNNNINYTLNGEKRIPGVMSLTFDGVKGNDLIISLDLEGIGASFGSACASGTAKPSSCLTETGMSLESAGSTIRISIGKLLTEEDISYVASTICHTLKKERKFIHAR